MTLRSHCRECISSFPNSHFPSTDIESSEIIDLIPNGRNIPVTNENRIRYIYLVANYRLNIQIGKQCKAFFRGLSTIIDPKWIRMFNQVKSPKPSTTVCDIHKLRQFLRYLERAADPFRRCYHPYRSRGSTSEHCVLWIQWRRRHYRKSVDSVTRGQQRAKEKVYKVCYIVFTAPSPWFQGVESAVLYSKCWCGRHAITNEFNLC
jgi:hypothetical protein